MSDAPANPTPSSRYSWLRSGLRWLPLVGIAALLVALIASGALRRLSLADLAAHHEQLMRFVGAHPLASLAVYIALFVALIVACAPGPSVMSIAGGFMFGPFLGGAAALLSVTAGSTIVFLACRTAFRDWAARRAGPTIARIEAGFSRDAFAYLLAMRLMPVAPVALVNLAAGLARLRLPTFVLATLAGSIPGAFIFAGLGSGLGRLFHRHERPDLHLLARPDIALPLMGLALLSLLPAVVRLWRGRQA
jgi:uncharacterized membrane protein YdjX (TVP38/TMEM64 family)